MDESVNETVEKLVGTRLADTRIGQSPVHPDELVRGAYWRVLNMSGGYLDVRVDRYWWGYANPQFFSGNPTGSVWAVIDPLGWYGMLTRHDVVEGDDGTISVRPGQPEIMIVRDTSADRWHGYIEQGVWIGAVSEAPPAEVAYDTSIDKLSTDPESGLKMPGRSSRRRVSGNRRRNQRRQ